MPEQAHEQEASRLLHDMKVSKSIGNHLAQPHFGDGSHIQSQNDLLKQFPW